MHGEESLGLDACLSLRVYCYPGLQPTMPLLLTGEATWVTERHRRGQSTFGLIGRHRTQDGQVSKFLKYVSIDIVLGKYSSEI